MRFWSTIKTILNDMRDNAEPIPMPMTPDPEIVRIEVKDSSGYWVPAGVSHSRDSLSRTMKDIQGYYYDKRPVRAVDREGNVVDMLNS